MDFLKMPGYSGSRKATFLTARNKALLSFSLACLLAVSSVSCAVTEPAPAPVATTQSVSFDDAWTAYSHRDFTIAMSAFDQVIENGSNDQKRQAWLGKALVYLSTDRDWRDLGQAQAAVQTASEFSGTGEAHSATVNLFGSAVEGHINAESDNTELNARINELLRELEQAKSARDSLAAENRKLVAEQEKLNAALERLKQLTLGN